MKKIIFFSKLIIHTSRYIMYLQTIVIRIRLYSINKFKHYKHRLHRLFFI